MPFSTLPTGGGVVPLVVPLSPPPGLWLQTVYLLRRVCVLLLSVCMCLQVMQQALKKYMQKSMA
jgi:hypothetical protein